MIIEIWKGAKTDFFLVWGISVWTLTRKVRKTFINVQNSSSPPFPPQWQPKAKKDGLEDFDKALWGIICVVCGVFSGTLRSRVACRLKVQTLLFRHFFLLSSFHNKPKQKEYHIRQHSWCFKSFSGELSAWTKCQSLLRRRVCPTDGHFFRFPTSVKQQKYIFRSLGNYSTHFECIFFVKILRKFQNFEFSSARLAPVQAGCLLVCTRLFQFCAE